VPAAAREGCSADDSRGGAGTIAQDGRGRVAGLFGFLAEHVHPLRRVEAGACGRARVERGDGFHARVFVRCECECLAERLETPVGAVDADDDTGEDRHRVTVSRDDRDNISAASGCGLDGNTRLESGLSRIRLLAHCATLRES
jgi:hypothetical protein